MIVINSIFLFAPEKQISGGINMPGKPGSVTLLTLSGQGNAAAFDKLRR